MRGGIVRTTGEMGGRLRDTSELQGRDIDGTLLLKVLYYRRVEYKE